MLEDLAPLESLVPDVMRAAVVFDKSIPASMALSDLARSAAEFARRTLVLTDEFTIPTQHGVPDYLIPCVAGVQVYHITEVRLGCHLLHGLASGYARRGSHEHSWIHNCQSGYYFEPATNTIHLATAHHGHLHPHHGHHGAHGLGHDYQPEYPWQLHHHLTQHHANGEVHDDHHHSHEHDDHHAHGLWMRVVLVPDGLSDAVPAPLLADGEWRDAIIAGAIATMAELHAPARAQYWRAKFDAAVTRSVVRRVTNYSSTAESRMSMTGRRFIRR